MARGRNIGNVYAELSVKDKMTVGIKRAESSLARLGKAMKNIGTGMAIAAPAAALGALTASMKSAITAGSLLSDMMARTGASGEGLFLMQRAFENAGVAGDKVPGVLNKMQKALAGLSDTGQRINTRVFTDLGLSIEELRSMDATGAFRRISESIAAIPDPAQRAALAMEIFGRSGGELLVMMNDGKAFEVAAKQVGGLGKTLADNAPQLDYIADAMGTLKIKAQQVGAEVAVELLPALQSLADTLNELDLGSATRDMIGFAKSIGTAADKMMELVKQSAAGQRLGLWGKAAGAGVSFVTGALNTVNTAAPKSADPFAADYYKDGIMLPPEWETAAKAMSEIPKLLKRRPDLAESVGFESSGIPMLADMMAAINRAATMPYDDAVQEERRIGDFQAQAYDVNEMQRRGLGMGGEGIAAKANKEVELLQQIRDLIRNAPDRDMVWN